MKILVLTNLYPPHIVGGYEVGCKEIVDGLKNRGHSVNVITSHYGLHRSEESDGVIRRLHIRFSEKSILSKILSPWRELLNRRIWTLSLKRFKPDLVYFWNLAGISYWCVFKTRQQGIPSVCYVSDEWVQRAPKDDYLLSRGNDSSSSIGGKIFRHLFGHLHQSGLFRTKWAVESIDKFQVPSQFLKNLLSQKVAPNKIEVIPWGVPDSYIEGAGISAKSDSHSVRILYASQIVPHKGILTAIRAITKLAELFTVDFHFSICGAGTQAFMAKVQTEAEFLTEKQLACFHGQVSLDQLQEEFAKADIYVFPSEWDEPFALSPLMAMASRCAVIATNTGGSAELFEDMINALVFKSGDSDELCKCLLKLISEPATRLQIAANARDLILKRYTMPRMQNEIEDSLKAVFETDQRLHTAANS